LRLTVPGIPTDVQEEFQVKENDLVIDIAADFGPVAEFEKFGVELGYRMLLWLPAAAQGGFTATGTLQTFRAAGGAYEIFSDADLQSCALTLASRDWVSQKEFLQVYLDSVKESASASSPRRSK
jgi:hypothetical protein